MNAGWIEYITIELRKCFTELKNFSFYLNYKFPKVYFCFLGKTIPIYLIKF